MANYGSGKLSQVENQSWRVVTSAKVFLLAETVELLGPDVDSDPCSRAPPRSDFKLQNQGMEVGLGSFTGCARHSFALKT